MKSYNYNSYKGLAKKPLSLILAFLLMAPLSPVTLAGTVAEEEEEATLADHEATVFGISGDVQILRNNEWQALQEGDPVFEGDTIRTAEDAYAEITYDAFYLNTIKVEESTTIEFRSIEETELYISTGSVFNDLGGQLEDSEYQLSTPVSVAAVRGTQFLRSFNPETLEDETSVIEGSVEVAPFDPSGRPNFSQSFQVNQDKALRFDREMIQNRNFRQAQVAAIPAARKTKLQNIRQASRNRLQKFAGGEARFRKAQERLHNIKQNPARSQRLRNQMRLGGQRFQRNPNRNKQDFGRPNQNQNDFQQNRRQGFNQRKQQLKQRNFGQGRNRQGTKSQNRFKNSRNQNFQNNRQNQFKRNQRGFQGTNNQNQRQGPRKPQGQNNRGQKFKNKR